LQTTQKNKKIKSLSVQPGLRGSDDLSVGRKMATNCFFQSVRAKNLSATLQLMTLFCGIMSQNFVSGCMYVP
jgi:hypothetical protein